MVPDYLDIQRTDIIEFQCSSYLLDVVKTRSTPETRRTGPEAFHHRSIRTSSRAVDLLRKHPPSSYHRGNWYDRHKHR